jgi:hypothetical protein
MQVALKSGMIERDVRYKKDGLAITISRYAFGEASGFSITHIASGYVPLSRIMTFKEAKIKLEKLLTLCDWTQSRDELKKIPGMLQKIQKIYNEEVG